MTRPTFIMSVLLAGLLMIATIWTARPESAAEVCEEGDAYLSMGKYDRAIAVFDRATQLDPTLARAYESRGRAHRTRGGYEKAIADCTRAIQLEPNDIEAYLNRGHCFESEGEYKAACDDYCDRARIVVEMARTYDSSIPAPRPRPEAHRDGSQGR